MGSAGKRIFVLYTSTKKSDYSPGVSLEVTIAPGASIESADFDASVLLEFYWRNSQANTWRLGCTVPIEAIKRDFKRRLIVRFDT